MVFGFPIAIWFGIFTFLSLVTTVILGIVFHWYHKPVFRYHKFFAFLTLLLALIHITYVILNIYFRISF